MDKYRNTLILLCTRVQKKELAVQKKELAVQKKELAVQKKEHEQVVF